MTSPWSKAAGLIGWYLVFSTVWHVAFGTPAEHYYRAVIASVGCGLMYGWLADWWEGRATARLRAVSREG